MKQQRIKGTPTQGMWGATIGFFFGFAAVSLYGPTAIIFKESMNLTPTMLGLLIAIPSLSGSLLRIPFGASVDISGGKKPFFILLLLGLIGLGGITLLLNASYPDGMQGRYGLVLFFGFLSGCGIATFSVGIGQTSYWFPRSRQGLALGTFAGVGNLAPGIFSLVLPLFLAKYGFISAYTAWFLFLLVGTILYGILGRDAYFFQYRRQGLSDKDAKIKASEKGQEIFPTGNAKESLINSARIPQTWALVALYFTTFGGFIALTAWFPTYWADLHGMIAVKAGLLTAVFSILASLVRVAGGSISDRIGGEKTALISMFLILVTSLILSFSSLLITGIIAVILLAVGMGIANAAVFKMVPVYVPESVGGAAGWIGGLGAFGGFVLPPVMGMIAGQFGMIGYARGFLVFLLLSAINIVILFSLSRNKSNIGN